MKHEKDELRSAAATFVVRLQQALSVARIHDLTNVALSEPIEELRASLGVVLASQGVASLKPEAEARLLFLNDRAIHLSKQGAATLEKLIELLAALGLGELRFERRLTAAQIRSLLKAFKDCTLPDPGENFAKLAAALQELDAPVKVLSTSEVASVARARSLKVDDALSTRFAYARTLVLLRAFLGHVGSDELQRYFWRKLVRAVHALQVLAARVPQDLIALTQVHDEEERPINHALNTCVLALLLGQELELPRQQLAPLGLAALLHGVGRFPADALLAREDLTPEQLEVYALTPYRTVGTLLAMHRFEDVTLLAALVAFQYESTRGHPRTREPLERPHPLARIVSICEAYDALTGPLPTREPIRPDRAMCMLLEGKPRAFDPTVLGAFARMLGVYPPGTPVRLSSGESGVVVKPGESPDRPVVAIRRGASGEDAGGALLDLGDEAARGRHIVAAID